MPPTYLSTVCLSFLQIAHKSLPPIHTVNSFQLSWKSERDFKALINFFAWPGRSSEMAPRKMVSNMKSLGISVKCISNMTGKIFSWKQVHGMHSKKSFLAPQNTSCVSQAAKHCITSIQKRYFRKHHVRTLRIGWVYNGSVQDMHAG